MTPQLEAKALCLRLFPVQKFDMWENVNKMDPWKFKLKLFNLYPMHIDYVTYEEIKKLLGTLLICANVSYGLNDILSFPLLILENML